MHVTSPTLIFVYIADALLPNGSHLPLTLTALVWIWTSEPYRTVAESSFNAKIEDKRYIIPTNLCKSTSRRAVKPIFHAEPGFLNNKSTFSLLQFHVWRAWTTTTGFARMLTSVAELCNLDQSHTVRTVVLAILIGGLIFEWLMHPHFTSRILFIFASNLHPV